MASIFYTECYVFIDDSNLWIEGQKTRAKELVDAENDPRFRVDLGKFLSLVAKDYHISKPFSTALSLLQTTRSGRQPRRRTTKSRPSSARAVDERRRWMWPWPVT